MEEKYLIIMRIFSGFYFLTTLLGWLWFGATEYVPIVHTYLALPALFIATTLPTRSYSTIVKYPVGIIYITAAFTASYVIYNQLNINDTQDYAAASSFFVEAIIYIAFAIIAFLPIQIKKSLTKSSSWTDNP